LNAARDLEKIRMLRKGHRESSKPQTLLNIKTVTKIKKHALKRPTSTYKHLKEIAASKRGSMNKSTFNAYNVKPSSQDGTKRSKSPSKSTSQEYAIPSRSIASVFDDINSDDDDEMMMLKSVRSKQKVLGSGNKKKK